MRQRINTSETTTRQRSDTGTTSHAIVRHKWNLGLPIRKFFTAWQGNCSRKLLCHQFSCGIITAADYPCQQQISVYDKRTSWRLPSCRGRQPYHACHLQSGTLISWFNSPRRIQPILQLTPPPRFGYVTSGFLCKRWNWRLFLFTRPGAFSHMHICM
jgi:hypothetical protein